MEDFSENYEREFGDFNDVEIIQNMNVNIKSIKDFKLIKLRT